jgi:hypothetical protein
MNDGVDSLDELIGRLESAAEQLLAVTGIRAEGACPPASAGELSTDAAATLVDECAALANRAGAELERRARAEALDQSRETRASDHPGQDSLL